MNRKPSPQKIVDMPAARRDTPNFIDIIWWRHWIYGLLEVDVTVPRRLIKEYEARSEEELSFTGFLAYCLARAVDEDKWVHAYLKGRKQLVIFQDVDVLLMIERQMGETRALPIASPTWKSTRRSEPCKTDRCRPAKGCRR